jgi:hypothetical protein
VIVDAAGRATPRTLVRLPGRDLERPAWSADGARIAVTATVHEPYRD